MPEKMTYEQGKVMERWALDVALLQHMASGWTHTVTLTEVEGDALRTAIKAVLPDFEKTSDAAGGPTTCRHDRLKS